MQELGRDLARKLGLRDDSLVDPSIMFLPDPEDGKTLVWDGNDGALRNSILAIDTLSQTILQAVADANAAAAAAAASEANAASSEANAGNSETNASASEAAAVSAAAETLYISVEDISFADSPFTPSVNDEGKLYRVDTSGGNVEVDLSDLATYGEDMKFAFVKATVDANTVNINTTGTDTFATLATTVTLSNQHDVHDIVGQLSTGLWQEIKPGSGGIGSFTALSDTPGSYAGQAYATPRVNTAENALTFANIGAMLLDSGNTAARPGAPVNGMVRYNTDTNKVEAYENGSWVALSDDLVLSVFGRTGAVTAAASDYDADQVDYDDGTTSLGATDVQGAIEALAALIGGGGGLVGMQVFTVPGAQAYTPTVGTTKIIGIITGGGGEGGGSFGQTGNVGGLSTFDCSFSGSVELIANGGNGGVSGFLGSGAVGGIGGIASVNGGVIGVGVDGQAGQGGMGESGNSWNCQPGIGGSSFWGGGGAANGGSPQAGNAWGSGGAGASNNRTATNNFAGGGGGAGGTAIGLIPSGFAGGTITIGSGAGSAQLGGNGKGGVMMILEF
jgi:hypothetical protein